MFDVYINDAFATAHRKEMTVHQLPMKSSTKGCGFLFKKEIDSLREVWAVPAIKLAIIRQKFQQN